MLEIIQTTEMWQKYGKKCDKMWKKRGKNVAKMWLIL